MEPSCVVLRAPSELESAMNTLIKVFMNHARKDGDMLRLNRSEMGNLFRQELRNLLEEVSSEDPGKLGEIMADLDKNRDGQVNFEEFIAMTTKLIMSTSVYFKEYSERLMCGYN